MHKRITWFQYSLSLCFLLGIILSYDLWALDRTFPSFPVFDIAIPNWLDWILRILLIVLVGWCAFNKKAAQATLLWLILMVFLDQMRLQPWVLFYVLMLIPFAFNANKQESTNFLRWCFIGLYVWSGFHKINTQFTQLIFESILVDGLKIFNPETLYILKKFALAVPFLEIGAGVLLIFPKTRSKGVFLGIIGHLFILYYLIFGLKGNWVVVPWNLFLMIGLTLLFYKDSDQLVIPRVLTQKIVLIIAFLLLPLGYLVGWTDHSLSLGLYDGRLKSAYLLNEESDTRYQIHQNLILKGSITDLNLWAFKELEVPFYPEDRFIKKLLSQKERRTILVTELPMWRRNLLGTFKTSEEKKEIVTVKNVDLLKFKDSIFIGGYKLLHK